MIATRILLGAAALLFLAHEADAQNIILPPENTELNRTHTQFRWEEFGGLRSDYTLEIVEDDGSANPFSGGFPVTTISVDRAEPRTVVTSGLEFGKLFAWRVSAMVVGQAHSIGPPKPIRRKTRIRRFRVAPPHEFVPTPDLIIPPGAGPAQPGITIFSARRTIVADQTAFILGFDEAGEMVLQMVLPQDVTAGDMRLMENGRIAYQRSSDVRQWPDGSFRQVCRVASVTTLDAATTWESPHDKCEIPEVPFQLEGVHHEVFPMPNGNFLALEYDNRLIPYPGADDDFWQGDKVVEYDRHTKVPVKVWSAFDGICLDDHLPDTHPGGNGPGGDWIHANAVVYNEADDSIYFNARAQSRVIRVDWTTMQIVYQLGDDSFPCGDVPLGFGDNLFSFQHAPEIQPNGNILLFNNGNWIEPWTLPRVSTVVELALDLTVSPPTATKVWEYELVLADLITPAYSNFVGDADRQPNGNTLAVDGRNANIIEVDANGDIVWFLDVAIGVPGTPMDPGAFVYRAERVPSIIVDTPSDTDGDWDVDLIDLGRMQVAFTGAGPKNLEFPETLSDHDGDDDIDGDDLDLFGFWMTGPGR